MTPEIPQILKDHWAGLTSGGALVHFLHIAWPWLKANNGLRGVWKVIVGTPPTISKTETVQPLPVPTATETTK